jgi:hypothetical protein
MKVVDVCTRTKYGYSLVLFFSVDKSDYYNFALNKPTFQATTAPGGYSYLGVNGDTAGQCVLTLSGPRQWWAVDMGSVKQVTYVLISHQGAVSSKLCS